jgi:hypothetical protein
MRLKLSLERGLTYYNYKRWIWTTMPWLAMYYRGNFSQAMQVYFPSQTETVTIQKEQRQYHKCLSIASGVRRQRQEIMENRMSKQVLARSHESQSSLRLHPEPSLIQASHYKFHRLVLDEVLSQDSQTLTFSPRRLAFMTERPPPAHQITALPSLTLRPVPQPQTTN